METKKLSITFHHNHERIRCISAHYYPDIEHQINVMEVMEAKTHFTRTEKKKRYRTQPPKNRKTIMPKLQALESIFFRINGTTFQCIGTLGTEDPYECIDIIKNLETQKIYQVKRSHTMSQNITWVNKK